jgi:hypothetical protein
MKRVAERVPIEQAAAILGSPDRTVQDLAARGKIPGAAKIGGRWSFDVAKLRRLIKQRERETWQNGKRRPDATGGEISSGAKLRLAGSAAGGRLTRMIQQSRKRVAKLAKPER